MRSRTSGSMVDSAARRSRPLDAFDADPLTLQVSLALLNQHRLRPDLPAPLSTSGPAPVDTFSVERHRAARFAEERFVLSERAAIRSLAAEAPTASGAFVDWFDSLRQVGAGQFDVLFDYLAEEASFEELRWFIRQEVAGEAGFEDLVALTQVKMPQQAKLELALNYWDEMGRGKPAAMHGPLLARLASALGVASTPLEETVWESLAVANLMVALACNRRYAYHSIGALGVIELTAPTRAVQVVRAFDRLGVDSDVSFYYRLHATIDLRHWAGWRANVLPSILAERPEAAWCVAEGALMRLQAGARTFDRYRAEFGIGSAHGRRQVALEPARS